MLDFPTTFNIPRSQMSTLLTPLEIENNTRSVARGIISYIKWSNDVDSWSVNFICTTRRQRGRGIYYNLKTLDFSKIEQTYSVFFENNIAWGIAFKNNVKNDIAWGIDFKNDIAWGIDFKD
jgi:hypothetical protein